MTNAQWLSEVARRIKAYEGLRRYKYLDTQAVQTLAWGWAIGVSQNPRAIVETAGGNWDQVKAAPTAIDSLPSHAVAECITTPVADAIFANLLPGYVGQARASLPPSIFDNLDEARRFVIVDLCYNMGAGPLGWGGFVGTQRLLTQAVTAKQVAKYTEASVLFEQAANHLQASQWFQQVGQRAVNDVAIIRTSSWTPPLLP